MASLRDADSVNVDCSDLLNPPINLLPLNLCQSPHLNLRSRVMAGFSVRLGRCEGAAIVGLTDAELDSVDCLDCMIHPPRNLLPLNLIPTSFLT